jgi:anti-sigma regulatory factor (Ser/Thr protein kinase)
MDQITVPARKEYLSEVLEFINQKLDHFPHQSSALLRLELAVEEAFVNIASHAYPDESGEVAVGLSIKEKPLTATVELTDSGSRFNPLKREDPDLSIGIGDKKPGGLGILLIKENSDQVHYHYKKGRNILTIQKKLDNDKVN